MPERNLPFFAMFSKYRPGEALAALLAEKRPAVFYSADLCARYFTCLREGESHFILFDDGETISRKIRLGSELGIPDGFLLYPESQDLLPQLFAPRGSGSRPD